MMLSSNILLAQAPLRWAPTRGPMQAFLYNMAFPPTEHTHTHTHTHTHNNGATRGEWARRHLKSGGRALVSGVYTYGHIIRRR